MICLNGQIPISDIKKIVYDEVKYMNVKQKEKFIRVVIQICKGLVSLANKIIYDKNVKEDFYIGFGDNNKYDISIYSARGFNNNYTYIIDVNGARTYVKNNEVYVDLSDLIDYLSDGYYYSILDCLISLNMIEYIMV